MTVAARALARLHAGGVTVWQGLQLSKGLVATLQGLQLCEGGCCFYFTVNEQGTPSRQRVYGAGVR